MHRSNARLFDPLVRMAPTIRRTGVTEYLAPSAISVRLDARELDRLGPFLGLVGDEFSEASG